jgi:hypothetical protein
VTLPPYEEIKGSIAEYVAENAKGALMNKLRTEVKVEILAEEPPK